MDVSAEETEIDISAFKYEENADGTINITDCNEKEETLVIPSEIEGKRVRAVKLNFNNDRLESECQIKRLVISRRNTKYLVSIGDYAFDNCSNLKNITLPNSLTSIGKGAFVQCRFLSKIIIPGNLKVIQRSTFFNCISLQEVEIKEGLNI